MCEWNVKMWVFTWWHYAVVRMGVSGEMWTFAKLFTCDKTFQNFSHVTRLHFHSGISKQIGSHIMVEIYLLMSRVDVKDEIWGGGGLGRHMKWVGCLTGNVIAAVGYMWGPTMQELSMWNVKIHYKWKLAFCKCEEFVCFVVFISFALS